MISQVAATAVCPEGASVVNGRSTRGSYQVDVDQVGSAAWAELLALFDDASIQQTWAVGGAGATQRSHLVVRREGEVVGICQVISRRFPLFGSLIADIHNGPLWRRKGRENTLEDFLELVRAIRDEYALKRGSFVRMWPNEFDNGSTAISGTLEQLGFSLNTALRRQRTILLPLGPPLEQLRKNLGSTWRLHLNRAERNELQVTAGTGDHLYEIFLRQLREMVSRKGFVPRVDYERYRVIQAQLGDTEKMRVLIAEQQGAPVASLVCSAFGDTGIYLFGATANVGLSTNASNLLHWQIVQWLKSNGYRAYDLGGIDPEANPGTYQFKRGLGGKLGEDRYRIGQFEFRRGVRQRWLAAALTHLPALRQRIRSLQSRR